MKKKNVTLSEIMIVIVVIGILATLGIPLYNNTIEDARAKACELNLKTILGAVEAQTSEQNSFPASLSKISDKNFRKAWAKVLKEEGAFKVKLVYFLVNFDERSLAYAATAGSKPWVGKFIGEGNILQCPSAHGGNSYGINANLTGKTYEEYKVEASTTIVVGDCNSNKFTSAASLASRHKHYELFRVNKYAIAIDKGKEKIKIRHGDILAGLGDAIGELSPGAGSHD